MVNREINGAVSKKPDTYSRIPLSRKWNSTISLVEFHYFSLSEIPLK